jgi:hypothetical protein
MATSDTVICNQALSLVGESPLLTIDDDTKAGRTCRLHYADTRDELLVQTRWHFATVRQWLARLATAPPFDYAYAYQLPQGGTLEAPYALRIDRVVPSPIRWEIQGRMLLADAAAVGIQYIGRITDTLRYPPHFTTYLTLSLAAKVAYDLAASDSLTVRLLQMADRQGTLARALNGIEGNRLDTGLSTPILLDVRGVVSD